MIAVSFSRFRLNTEVTNPRTKRFFPRSLAVPPERFDRGARNRNSDMTNTLVGSIRLDVIRVIKTNAAIAQRRDMAVVTVLVKRHKNVGFVAGRKHFSGSEVHLENRRPARDRRGNRHVSHDLATTAPRETRKESTDRLDAVLRVSRKANHRILDALVRRLFVIRFRRDGLILGRRNLRCCAHASRGTKSPEFRRKQVSRKPRPAK